MGGCDNGGGSVRAGLVPVGGSAGDRCTVAGDAATDAVAVDGLLVTPGIPALHVKSTTAGDRGD